MRFLKTNEFSFFFDKNLVFSPKIVILFNIVESDKFPGDCSLNDFFFLQKCLFQLYCDFFCKITTI